MRGASVINQYSRKLQTGKKQRSYVTIVRIYLNKTNIENRLAKKGFIMPKKVRCITDYWCCLYKGKIYDVLGIEDGMYQIIDESGDCMNLEILR